jgi:hypothetical protein
MRALFVWIWFFIKIVVFFSRNNLYKIGLPNLNIISVSLVLLFVI